MILTHLLRPPTPLYLTCFFVLALQTPNPSNPNAYVLYTIHAGECVWRETQLCVWFHSKLKSIAGGSLCSLDAVSFSS